MKRPTPTLLALLAVLLGGACRAPVEVPELPEQRTASGLVIRDLEIGAGEEVVQGSHVTVHYVGRFSDGQRFDSSRDRGEPFAFTVGSGEVIPGWEEGMLGMRAGGQRRIRIPPELGFTADAAEARVLELEVELLDTERPERRGCGG
jgi:FKBP-type peptidyl-prolyl cis-trans isomerase